MQHRRIGVILALSALAVILSGCLVSREEQDAKLQTACISAVKALSSPDDTFEVKSSSFVTELSPDHTTLRTVNVHTYYTRNHGAVEEKDYTCSFEENASIFGFHPRFYRLDKGGEKYGNFTGVIEGNLDDMMKINQVMNTALEP